MYLNIGDVVIFLQYILRIMWFFHILLVYRTDFTYPWGISKTTSCNQWYIGRPLSNNCALDNTTTEWSSHVPCVYRETLLGILRPCEHSPLTVLSSQYTKNNIWGDYYTCIVQVVGYSSKGMVPILFVMFYCWTLHYIVSFNNLKILVRNPFISPSYHLIFHVILACAGLFVCHIFFW